MKQTGIVKAKNGDYVTVRIKRISACGGNCASCGGSCNAGEMLVSAENKAGADIGDTVEIEMPSSKILGAAAWIYIIPFVIFIAAYVLLYYKLFQNEIVSFLISFGAMAAIYAAIVAWNRKNKDKYHLAVEKIL